MAAVTLLGSTFTTTAGAKSVTATPAVGDLILIFLAASDDSTFSSPTDNNSSGTYTLLKDMQDAGTNRYGQWYARNSLIASATSTIFTMPSPGTDSGGGLAVLKVTGMTKVGSAAKRQSMDYVFTAGTTPETGTWASAKLTTNPVVGALINVSNTAAVTPTSGYSELLDTGYSTPTTGIEIQKRDSGDTTNTMTWGSTSATGGGCIGVELDATDRNGMFLVF